MLIARYSPLRLHFTFEAVTSRQRMHYKDTFIVRLFDSDRPDIVGTGECALFRGLSADDRPDYEDVLQRACQNPLDVSVYAAYSSIRIGMETALADLKSGGRGVFVDNTFTRGESFIPINGLIWMGDKQLMAERIRAKLDDGFRCLKLKIGGINFDDELSLLAYIRSVFPADRLELRLDANGSFSKDNALSRLERLSTFGIHSIEQPIRAGQLDEMARICRESPIPIALDEELIGVTPDEEKMQMLDFVRPDYIILKPSLCGGFAEADKWIASAERLSIGWWATSALESNVGLNAIAQWVSTKKTSMVQGLGTGGLYSNNLPSRLSLQADKLYFRP